MIMLARLIRATFTSILLSLGLTLSSYAHISSEQLQAEITKAKILPPDAKVTTAITGSELTVSTYKLEKATENDCKIDAVLISKTAFAADPEFSRVVVIFYDPIYPTSYDEIPVTLGDVTAFGSGSLSKGQLLSELKLTKRSASGSTVSSPSSVSTAQSSSTTSESTGTSTLKQDTHEPASKLATVSSVSTSKASNRASSSPQISSKSIYSNSGVKLSYPSQWRITYPQGGNTVVRFFLPNNSGLQTSVEIQLVSRHYMTPAEIVEADPRDTLEATYDMAWLQASEGPMRAHAARKIEEVHAATEHARIVFEQKGKSAAFPAWRLQQHNLYTTLNPVSMPSSINIGKGKLIHCSQKAYWLSPSNEQLGQDYSSFLPEGIREKVSHWQKTMWARHFIRLVAFNCQESTVLLALFCAEPDSSAANSQFEQTVADLQCSSSPHPSTARKSKGAK
jgi:hypothetical protein